MITMQISLREDQQQRLENEARRLNISVEQLVELGITDMLAVPEEEFDKLAGRVVRENHELYRRLAG